MLNIDPLFSNYAYQTKWKQTTKRMQVVSHMDSQWDRLLRTFQIQERFCKIKEENMDSTQSDGMDIFGQEARRERKQHPVRQ